MDVLGLVKRHCMFRLKCSDVQMLEDSQDNSNNFNTMESSDTENAGSNGKQPNLENSEVS